MSLCLFLLLQVTFVVSAFVTDQPAGSGTLYPSLVASPHATIHSARLASCHGAKLQTSLFAKDPDNEDDETWVDPSDADSQQRRDLLYNLGAVGLLGLSGVSALSLFQTNVYTPSGFQRLPRTQFLAALGNPTASEGSNARDWGLWTLDPGPRGVWLSDYKSQLAGGPHQAPAGWKFDSNDWWLEEHGLIMESPYFPVPAGRYLVTGGRLVTTGLTIRPDGSWKLDSGTLQDVTHLPCRSARYTPDPSASVEGSPLTANPRDFPVAPGAKMPAVPGCNQQDYAVLFVVGKEA